MPFTAHAILIIYETDACLVLVRDSSDYYLIKVSSKLSATNNDFSSIDEMATTKQLFLPMSNTSLSSSLRRDETNDEKKTWMLRNWNRSKKQKQSLEGRFSPDQSWTKYSIQNDCCFCVVLKRPYRPSR